MAFSGSEDAIEQIALVVCAVYGFTPERVDNMSKLEFMLYSQRIKQLSDRIIKRPWYRRRLLLTDASKITLGQFIEIQHWSKMGEVDSLPLIAASILLKRGDHKADTERMLRTDARRLLHDIKAFMQSFQQLLESYSGLFEKPEAKGDETEEEIEALEKERALEVHPFIEQYGWIFSAKKVAEYEGITLEQAYGLPVIQAFNDLAYLKSEQDYQKQINK